MAGRPSAAMNLLLLVFLASAFAQDDVDEEADLDFLGWFAKGEVAYLDNHWSECVEAMQNSIADFKRYKSEVIRCRIGCRDEAEAAQPLSPVDIEDLGFFERQLRATLCMLKCKEQKRIKRVGAYSKDILSRFEQLQPYDYIQLCYFQRNELKKAADAAFTFLVANPSHESMSRNLKFFLDLPEVDNNDVTNLEAKRYVSLYIHGVDLYGKENYEAAVQHMEESLADYLQNERECRAYCEKPFDQGWYPEFVPSIANHFAFVLKCKSNCSYNMNNLNGEKYDDLLPSHYHYLQYSYFKVDKLMEAIEAAVSYLLFYPEDKDMLENVKYYKSLPNANPELFKPRKEAVDYIQRYKYEQKILNFIQSEFNFKSVNKKGDDEEVETKDDPASPDKNEIENTEIKKDS
ncbi:Hypothetical predicted protein [Cloeon dipterum]|uniref:Leprecan-like alpha-helical domain-containing protein n=1 Tax=Cloeon dipterum TaxID=197152 RepID=A0A8S1CMG5_9INSE|nr:Hypothetical predicted protein [Cloeon dipterum]